MKDRGIRVALIEAFPVAVMAVIPAGLVVAAVFAAAVYWPWGAAAVPVGLALACRGVRWMADRPIPDTGQRRGWVRTWWSSPGWPAVFRNRPADADTERGVR